MAFKRGGLGKGLNALLTQFKKQAEESRGEIQQLDAAKIKPNRWQPRRTFEEAPLRELAESIKLYGVLQPLIVRPDADGFELISGERRLRASKLAGLTTVPAIVRNFSDNQIREIAIIENVQRENLNPVEEARAYERLINEFGYTKEGLASKIGFSTARLVMLLRLLKLSPQVQNLIIDGQLTISQALPLLAIDNHELQIQTAEIVVSEKLSARKVNAFIAELKTQGVIESLTRSIENDLPIEIDIEEFKNEPVEEPEFDMPEQSESSEETDENTFFIRRAEVELSRHFGRPVKISSGRRRNKIQIGFKDIDDLMALLKEIEQPSKAATTKGDKN